MDKMKVETLEVLLARYSRIEKMPEVERVKFADAVRTGEDPLRVIQYLATLGIEVKTPADLFRINDDDSEEELVCFWIPEGVAATISSDDLWMVFEVDHASKATGTATAIPSSADGSALA